LQQATGRKRRSLKKPSPRPNLAWEKGDTFVAPPWHWITHDNPTGVPACLFQFNDEPAVRALGLFHEET